MIRLGPRSRVHLSACAYAFAAIAVTGGAFFLTLTLVPGESVAAAGPQISVGKIGPGYARMRPIDLGRPEKVAYSTPYYPHVTAARAARANKHPAPIVIAKSPTKTIAPPIMIAAADQSSYSLTDIHRVY